MKKFLLLTLIVLLTIIIVTTDVFAYGASTFVLRYDAFEGRLAFNSALAMAGNFLLDNGTMYVYASVDSPDTNSASFGNQSIFMSASDIGPYSSSGTASASVNGYDKDGKYQSDSDSDSN